MHDYYNHAHFKYFDMKLFILLMLLFNNVRAQKEFTIVFLTSNTYNNKVYLKNTWANDGRNTKQITVDSARIINGVVKFKGKFSELGYYNLSVDSMKGFLPFIIDTGTITIKGDIKKIWKSKIENSYQNDMAYQASNIVDSMFVIRENLQDSMVKYQSNGNPDLSKFYSKSMDLVDSTLSAYMYGFTLKNRTSYYAFNFIKQFHSLTKTTNEISKKVFLEFDLQLLNSSEGKYLKYILFEYDKNKIIGSIYQKSTFTNINNKKINIPIDKNNITLIDYWASWCIPCIAHHQELKKLYSSTNRKDFEILSISLDTSFEIWKQALKKNNILWKNFVDLKGFESVNVKKYGILSIPFSLLIDSTGKILHISPTIDQLSIYLK